MANTINIDAIQWNGIRGSVHFVVTSDGTAITDLAIVDISADLSPAPASIKLRSIDAVVNGDWTAIFEFDATTDQEIERIGGQTDITHYLARDYTDMPNGGKQADNKAAAGFTGDLLLTSSGLANLDEGNFLIVFEKDS